MIRVHRAAWILPIAEPPIRDGWIAVEGDRIAALGSDRGGPAPRPGHGPALDPPGRIAILPGLVNAHVHLELSWMRGQVGAGTSMPVWASRLMALRRAVGSEPAEPIAQAIAEARASGTALVGDITNTLAAHAPLLRSRMAAMIFRELLGFSVEAPDEPIAAAQRQIAALPPSDRVRCGIVPHAPYSVSPRLLAAIADATSAMPLSIHLGESVEELEFLQEGSGAWREILQSVGAWNPAWRPPGRAPVAYLDEAGLLGPRLLAVHGVHLTDRELARLAGAQATVVTCPRSNRWTGAGDPPVERFYASGVRVAIGTDSLASVDSLNMFDEIAAVRRLAPSVPASRILRSATLDGAAALGFGSDLGSIEPGKRAALIAIDIPADVQDVEEYLVSGIAPSAVRWLRAADAAR